MELIEASRFGETAASALCGSLVEVRNLEVTFQHLSELELHMTRYDMGEHKM